LLKKNICGKLMISIVVSMQKQCVPHVIYNWKICTLLDDQAYRKVTKDSTDAVECNTVLLLKKSTDEISKQLRPMGITSPRLYRLLKIQKEGNRLRPIMSNTGAPTYQLSKHWPSYLVHWLDAPSIL
jgi:hypothetical protein